MDKILRTRDDYEIQKSIHENYRKNFIKDYEEESEYLKLSIIDKITIGFATSIFCVGFIFIMSLIEHLRF